MQPLKIIGTPGRIRTWIQGNNIRSGSHAEIVQDDIETLP